MLQEITISGFTNSAGTSQNISFTYQIFGRELGEAPIVLINHSLTGNSQITGKTGWLVPPAFWPFPALGSSRISTIAAF